MIRPMLKAWSPWGMPQPQIKSSTEVGSTSGLRSRSWSTMKAPVSSGRSCESEPLKALPIGVRTASTITASGMGQKSPWRLEGFERLAGSAVLAPIGDRAALLLRRHPQGPIKSNDLAVEHGVLGDRAGQMGELLRPSQPLRKGHRLAQRLARVLGQRR